MIAGYAAAWFVADAAVNARFLQQSAQAQASPGMYAWGDLILFLEVFGLGAIVPTALALYFLRPVGTFWTALSIGALAFAMTGLLAALMVALGYRETTQSFLAILAAIGALREMMSPAAAVMFVLATLTAPTRRARLVLLVAAVIEGALGLYSFFQWFAPIHVL